MTHRDADSGGIWLPGGAQVGSGVSEVQAAFVTTVAGLLPFVAAPQSDSKCRVYAVGKVLQSSGHPFASGLEAAKAAKAMGAGGKYP